MTLRVLVVDNHDSFVHTLVGYLRELNAHVDIVTADDPTAVTRSAAYDAIMISPGPGNPESAGASVDIVRAAAAIGQPLLGVCLGHQAIGAAFGMPIIEAPELMHGMVSDMSHDSTGLFDEIPSPVTVGRYHSLALAEADLPGDLAVTARTSTGTVMALQHRTLPIWGIQFHPESVLTEHGYRLLANWLALAGDPAAVAASAGLKPLSN